MNQEKANVAIKDRVYRVSEDPTTAINEFHNDKDDSKINIDENEYNTEDFHVAASCQKIP